MSQILLLTLYLKLIQIYAPTSMQGDEEIDEFYSNIEKALETNPCKYTILMGDFNARIMRKRIRR